MNGAPWWVVLIAAAIGATAGVAGSTWSSHVQRRSAGRTEWFRRLQWACEQTGPDDVQRTAAGMSVMDYIADSANRRDAAMIIAITPIMREIGGLVRDNPDPMTAIDTTEEIDDTGRAVTWEDGGDDDSRPQAR